MPAAELVGDALPALSGRRQLQGGLFGSWSPTHACAVGAAQTCRWVLDDDDFFVLTLPWAFSWFGTLYSEIAVASNGYVVFGDNVTQADLGIQS